MAAKETKQQEEAKRVVTRYDKKMQRRKEEAERAAREQRMFRLVGILIAAVILLAVISIPVRHYFATHSTYITVGTHDITKAEFDYYYSMTSNDYLNTYGSYLSYMGLDVTGDFEKQSYSDTMSWKDYFDRLTVDSIKQHYALLDAANAEGFVHDTKEEYDAFLQALKDSAAESGMTLSRFYKETFGEYANGSRIRKYVSEGYVATAYYKLLAERNAASEEEIRAYYEENAAEYDSVDYLLTEVAAEIPEGEKTLDATGAEVIADPTEEQIAAAMEEAKARADEALAVIGTEGEAHTNCLKSSISIRYNEWLFDDARKEGDTTIIEDDTSHKYYVLMFQDRYLDDEMTVNIRAIMSAETAGDVILTEWQSMGATEEAFAGLAAKYSGDTSSGTDGGLYENLSASALSDAMVEWLFADGRKSGDTGVVSDSGVDYVFYYISEGLPAWQAKISNSLLSDTMDSLLTEMEAAYEVKDAKGNLTYLKVEE